MDFKLKFLGGVLFSSKENISFYLAFLFLEPAQSFAQNKPIAEINEFSRLLKVLSSTIIKKQSNGKLWSPQIIQEQTCQYS